MCVSECDNLNKYGKLNAHQLNSVTSNKFVYSHAYKGVVFKLILKTTVIGAGLLEELTYLLYPGRVISREMWPRSEVTLPQQRLWRMQHMDWPCSCIGRLWLQLLRLEQHTDKSQNQWDTVLQDMAQILLLLKHSDTHKTDL